VAYREMGLFEDAIEEFELVSRIPKQKVSALYQMGLTRMGMEQYAEAKDLFDRALKEPEMADQEKLSVSYDLGEVLLKLDKKDKAKKLFEQVKSIDPEFREVQEKIKALG
jgi:tetratricopeptide (TPR) repeat protein